MRYGSFRNLFEHGDVLEVYQKAFAGFPWFENLTKKEVTKRWQEQISKRGFFCEIATADDEELIARYKGKIKRGVRGGERLIVPVIVGFSSLYTLDHDELSQERGENLARFADEHAAPDVSLVWYGDTCVLPEFQGLGIGQELKKWSLRVIQNSYSDVLILTRMRDDNTGIIRINTSLGFERTGIRLPSSQKKDVYHEYWYLRCGGKHEHTLCRIC